MIARERLFVQGQLRHLFPQRILFFFEFAFDTLCVGQISSCVIEILSQHVALFLHFFPVFIQLLQLLLHLCPCLPLALQLLLECVEFPS